MEEFIKFIGIIFLVILGIALAFVLLIVLCSVGALFGSGVSIKNYYRSFRENVAFEKPYI